MGYGLHGHHPNPNMYSASPQRPRCLTNKKPLFLQVEVSRKETASHVVEGHAAAQGKAGRRHAT